MTSTRIIVAFVALALAVVGALLTRTLNWADSPAAAEILSVDQVAKDPASFADREVCLTGVVSAVLPEQELFAVIDRAEYADCKVVTCSQFQIPIAYAGDLPSLEVAVLVSGRLTQPEPGRYLFQAAAVELSQ